MAQAHPHVLVEARASVIFDAEQHMTAIRHTWKFDEAYSSFATLGLDTDGDGVLSQAELIPLAQVNIESLHEFAYFTFVKIGGESLAFRDPDTYMLTSDGTQLELDFILPLVRPAPLAKRTAIEIYDPEYFVAFTMRDAAALDLVDAPSGCTTTFHPPGELDAQTMSELADIPADQRELPDELQDAAAVFANLFILECRG